MSKYQILWEAVAASGRECLILSFAEVAEIAGVPMDHSFLQYKKELLPYGYQVDRISLKKQKVSFRRTEEETT